PPPLPRLLPASPVGPHLSVTAPFTGAQARQGLRGPGDGGVRGGVPAAGGEEPAAPGAGAGLPADPPGGGAAAAGRGGAGGGGGAAAGGEPETGPGPGDRPRGPGCAPLVREKRRTSPAVRMLFLVNRPWRRRRPCHSGMFLIRKRA